jgi:hypothetical protein
MERPAVRRPFLLFANVAAGRLGFLRCPGGNMKRSLSVVALVLMAFTLLIAQSEKSSKAKSKTKAAGHEAKLVAPEQLMWSPFVPGIEKAVVTCDPSKAGMFVLRLRATDDAKIMPHWHPTDEYVTILSGEASVGMGKKWDDAQLKAGPVHAVAMMPAHMPHYAQFKKGAEVQVHGMGPFAINYVNPADDPNNK